MSQSFGIVEEKLREAEFFLDELCKTDRLSFQARCFFSAFVSAARSVTLSLQATMNDVDGFSDWYEQAQARLKFDPLAQFFVEIRNGSIHKGLNPLDEVTLEHLRDDLSLQIKEPRMGLFLRTLNKYLPSISSLSSQWYLIAMSGSGALLIRAGTSRRTTFWLWARTLETRSKNTDFPVIGHHSSQTK
jgi:hypothetical protein